MFAPKKNTRRLESELSEILQVPILAFSTVIQLESIALQKQTTPNMTLEECLRTMSDVYRSDPVKAVRGQSFIKLLHKYLADEIRTRLSKKAVRDGIKVVEEATIHGAHKSKDVDVAVIDPANGPLILIGLRSQMSSVGKNALTYYQDIIGECITLQERFPLTVCGYVYLHPLVPVKEGKESENIDHARWARMYEAIAGRDGQMYKSIRGVYDHFAYMVVDFNTDPLQLHDEIAEAVVPDLDMSIATFVDRMIATFKKRNFFLDIFD